jgi:hypothetical protein
MPEECTYTEINYRTGKVINSQLRGWVAKATWLSSRNQIVFGVFVQQNFQIQQGGAAMGYPYYTNWRLQSGRKTDVSCICNPDLVNKYGAGFITYLRFNARDGAFYSDDDPGTQDIDYSKKASWISGLVYEKDPEKPIINTPHGPLTPILISNPLEWSGDRELVPFNGTGIEAYLGPVQALKERESATVKNRNEGVSRAITSEDDGCAGKALWSPDHSIGLYTYYCEFETFSEVLAHDGKRMEVSISQRDADRYWCGSVWEGTEQYFDLCKSSVVPERFIKYYELGGPLDKNLVWVRKADPTTTGEREINNLVGLSNSSDYDLELGKPEIYEAAAIESVEFLFCGCGPGEIECIDSDGKICCINCCEIGQTVIDIFSKVLK